MQISTPDKSQLFYARLAGFAYFVNYLTSVVGVVAASRIKGSGDFIDQARRILASEHLYRAALVSITVGWVLIVILAYALYVTLRPVSQRLAQIALLMEICQASVGAVTVLASFTTLRLYTFAQTNGSFANEQLQTLVSAARDATDSGFQISMIFLSVGSTIFFYLFYRSRFFPRALAAWGMFASVVMGMVSFGILIFPEHSRTFLYGWAPIGIAEVGTALWLMIAGIRPKRLAAAEARAE